MRKVWIFCTVALFAFNANATNIKDEIRPQVIIKTVNKTFAQIKEEFDKRFDNEDLNCHVHVFNPGCEFNYTDFVLNLMSDDGKKVHDKLPNYIYILEKNDPNISLLKSFSYISEEPLEGDLDKPEQAVFAECLKKAGLLDQEGEMIEKCTQNQLDKLANLMLKHTNQKHAQSAIKKIRAVLQNLQQQNKLDEQQKMMLQAFNPDKKQ